jgi:hypothetical protein
MLFNKRNQPMALNNTSGVTGVRWRPARGRWVAQIMVGRRYKHLGYFGTLAEAAAARKKAEMSYGFHVNHGRRGPRHDIYIPKLEVLTHV